MGMWYTHTLALPPSNEYNQHMYFTVFKQLAIMALIAVVGFSVTRIFKFGKTEQQFFSKILLYVINPCVIFNIFNVEFSSARLKELSVAFILSWVAHLALTILAFIFCRSKKPEVKDLDYLDRIAVVFTNSGFIGIPLINGVFGQAGAFYLMGYLAVFNIYLWTFGYYMVTRKMQPLKIITNPNIIAVVAGIIIFCIPGQLPDIIASPVRHISDTNAAVSMLLLGMLFATFTKPKGSVKEFVLRIAKTTLVRLVFSAVVMFFIAWAAISLFSTMENIRLISYVVFIAALCPVGMSVSSLAVVFNRDESYSSMLVAVSSALCILTLPLSVAIAERFF